MTVGRNDPCPCGSGRKFKKCCLDKDGPASRPFTPAERERALDRLARFSGRAEFEAERESASLAFWAGRLDRRLREEVERARQESGYAWTTWFCFDFPLAQGGTVADRFLEREGGRLPAGEREYLSRMRLTHLRLYEVVDVKSEEGLGVVDAWTDERHWVCERLGTRQLVRWDLVALRLVPGAEGDLVIHGATHLYPAAEKEEILKALRRAHRAFRRRFPAGDLTAFFKRAGALFHHRWLDHVALRPRPVFVTPEGDPVLFAKAVFDVRDWETVRTALAGHPDLDEQDDGSYAWREPKDPDGFGRGLGTFAVDGDRVVLEAMSLPRAARGRRLLEELVGAAVRFRATRCRAVEHALREPPPLPEPPQPEVPPAPGAQLVFEFYDRHWSDIPLLSLGNRTPREAARLAKVRPVLVALLKDFETRAERLRREGRPVHDFAWLWEAFGLPRPE